MDIVDKIAVNMDGNEPYGGKVVYKAWNDLSRAFEEVFPESEIGSDQMVIPLYWMESINRYCTIPGTEVYGYVPEVSHENN